MMRSALAFFALSICANVATAEEVDISGKWTFTADVHRSCTFHGEATLSPNADTTVSDFACELIARQSCTDGYEAAVRQSCRVRNTRGQIWLKATIEEFLIGEQDGSYEPDNFSLSVQSDNEMIGVLTNDHGQKRAVWTRTRGSIS